VQFDIQQKLAAEKRWDTHFLSNEGNEIRTEHYIETDTAEARKGVEDAEAVFQQEQEDKTHA